MGFYRSIRTALWKRALTDSIEIRFREFSVFQPFVFKRRMKQDHVARPRRLMRLPALTFVTAVCLVLSISSIAIWMHTTSLVTQCTTDHPFRKENLGLVNWIPNAHYSGDYGLMKLVISDVLPCKIKRVILLDLDTLVEGNLISIWESAGTFEKEEIIGLVENQSDWYLKEHGNSSWPALVSSMFDTYRNLQIDETVKPWSRIQYRGSANGLAKDARSRLELALEKGGTKVTEKYVPHTLGGSATHLRLQFALTLDRLSNFDGNLFRETDNLHSPTRNKVGTQIRQRGTVKACSFLHMEMRLQRRVFPHFYGIISNITANVTLVSQFTMDRLHRLEEIAANWEGPMSLAVYITDREAGIITEYLDSSMFFTSRENIGIHLVFQEGSYYPINALRNTAIKYADTAYVFIVDFDFVPKPHLHIYFQRTLASVCFRLFEAFKQKNQLEIHNVYSLYFSIRDFLMKVVLFYLQVDEVEKVAYIVPAFETFYTQLEFPTTKRHLLQNIASGVVKPFRIDVWQAGHLATNYSHWYKAEMPYEVKWDADFEPYVLIRRGHGQFDEHFVGFGWNKVSFFMLLDALDFKFVVLPNAFIIHLPHAPSVESNRFRHSYGLRQCLEDFKVKYIKDLAVRFGVKSLKYLRFRHRTIGL
ncbi:unnamed protein product [Taenia asiatica]|uniref:Glyco_transf_64 domain-containing protein n=1 Tax=Taenia asiatica TaxID=60517 RepID=A0A0R3WAS1_TAEAS|nr:unnamed protein product [Taenia asiatica]